MTIELQDEISTKGSECTKAIICKNKSDLFYSDANMAHLRRGIKALNTGQGQKHELLLERETRLSCLFRL